jgi:hypothetical protein
MIGFAFFLYGSVAESPYGRTQIFDRIVSNPEGSGQSMFQGFALGIEGLLCRWWNREVSIL